MTSVLDGIRKQINKKYEKEGYLVDVTSVGVKEDKFKSTFSLKLKAIINPPILKL